MQPIKVIGLAALLAAGAAMAQSGPGPGGNGPVTLDEYQQAASAAAAKRFERLDTNHDGELSAAERAAGRHPGPWRRGRGNGGLFGADGKASLADVQARMPNIPADTLAALDTNHDGMLSREELRSGRAQIASAMFAKIDTNGDGKLSLAELQAAHPNMTADRFKRLDRNGDGFVTQDELRPHGMHARFGPPPGPPPGPGVDSAQ